MSSPPQCSEARFTRRVGLFTVGTLVSRLLGLVRESVFAYLFGAGFATDAFNVAFRIPNFFRDLFAESALSAAFVPTFVQSLKRGDPEESRRFAANIFYTIILVVGLITAAGVAFAPWIVRVVAMGFAENPDKLQLTVSLTRLMFPFLLLVALAAWAMGILNACGTFFTPAVAPGAFNLVSIAVPILAYGYLRARGIEPVTGMALGVSVGALAQFLIQYPHLHRHGFRPARPALKLKDPGLRAVLLRWIPMALGLATWQINFLVSTFLLTFLREGSVTWVSYAYRIQHLPAGLFGAAIGTVALAEYSHLAASEPGSAIRDRFRHAMGLVGALTLPAAFLLAALAEPVVRLVYQHGRFTQADTIFTAQALAFYCIGIWPAAATRNCAAGFYSLGNTRTPAIIAACVVLLSVGMNLVLMRHIQFRSFPLTTSVVQLGNFAALFLLLRRRTGGLHGRELALSTLKMLGASACAGLLAFLAARVYEMHIPVTTVWLRAGQILIAGLSGLALYFVLGRLLRCREIGDALYLIIPAKR